MNSNKIPLFLKQPINNPFFVLPFFTKVLTFNFNVLIPLVLFLQENQKDVDSGTPENEKDATTEKEAKVNEEEKEAAPLTNGESEPKVENGDSTPTPEDGKKPKKEKVILLKINNLNLLLLVLSLHECDYLPKILTKHVMTGQEEMVAQIDQFQQKRQTQTRKEAKRRGTQN